MTAIFTPDDALAAASAETGLSNFGDDGFIEGLNVYLGSVAQEGDLTEAGAAMTQASIVRLLVNKLRYVADLTKHPEIAHERIVAPIVILGVTRTGTTKLQRMLSSAPDVQVLNFWRSMYPAPIPGAAQGADDPRIAMALEYEALIRQVAPEFMAIHPTLAREADEEAYLLDMSFECLLWRLRSKAPTYASWLSARPGDYPYQVLREMLQYLQWQGGGHRARPWILKSPLHLGNLPALLRAFPDAVLVHCHRDLAQVMPSTCRLFEMARGLVSNKVDPVELGTEMLELWAQEMHRYIRDRAASGAAILDVDYRDILHDAPAVAARVYAHAGRELSSEAQQRFAQWERDNPQHGYGSYTYDLATYGLTEEKIAHAFPATPT